jgi:hypothetical protein
MAAASPLGEVPVIDLLAMDSATAAAAVNAALARFGFFYVRNHGISEELLAKQCARACSSQRQRTRRDAAPRRDPSQVRYQRLRVRAARRHEDGDAFRPVA